MKQFNQNILFQYNHKATAEYGCVKTTASESASGWYTENFLQKHNFAESLLYAAYTVVWQGCTVPVREASLDGQYFRDYWSNAWSYLRGFQVAFF